MTGYEIINKVGSPRLHLLNLMREYKVYSECPKEGFVKIQDELGYYFSEDIIDNDFDLSKCIHAKRGKEFMALTGYTRPKINNLMELHGRVVYLEHGYYDMEAFRAFLPVHIKEYVEKRGRPSRNYMTHLVTIKTHEREKNLSGGEI